MTAKELERCEICPVGNKMELKEIMEEVKDERIHNRRMDS